jgi:ribosome-associated toxin RatA of RatAB toxin-antitoxin module
MPLVSKTVEVNADADSILRIVADFETYPDWNTEVKAVYVLARYDDGRPSQLRLDMEIQGQSGTFIQAVYYPDAGQIQTVLQRCSPSRISCSRWSRWDRRAC